ncbi:MAG: DUF4112 domain-containing protein [Deltaproteobacteria bacterium]
MSVGYENFYGGEGARLRWIRRFAYLLDNSIEIPALGYRIGLDAIIGLIPGVGDIAGGILSGVIVAEAYRMGAPRGVLARMLLNIAIEVIIGAVPVAGDLFDAAWKANTRNVALLDEYLRGR